MTGAQVSCGGCGKRWWVEEWPKAAASLEEHRATEHAGDDLGPSPLDAAVPAEREPGEDG